MNPDDSDDMPPAKFNDLLSDLEKLAGKVDAQKYPGQAWHTATITMRRPARLILWKAAAALMAAAAAVAIAVDVHHWRASVSPGRPAPGGGPIVQTPMQRDHQTPVTASLPLVIIVEDLDSYSLIDLTGDVPLVSFATKNSSQFECVVPMASFAAPDATTKNNRL